MEKKIIKKYMKHKSVSTVPNVFLLALMLGTSIVWGGFSQSASNALEEPHSVTKSAAQANRRTAMRCLTLANDYASAKDWQAVVAQTTLGLSYDRTLSDLWYMLALAQNMLGETKASVAASVERALVENNWVNYNRDSARILYADILCDTGRFAQVFAVLDGRFSGAQDYINAPYIYSADAEYIRAKAYYRLKDRTSVALAREKIDDSRQVYPEDMRFPLLFFTNESPESQDAQVAVMARQWIAEIKDFADAAPDKNAELEIYAAAFAESETQKRMLQSFAARGLTHPLYAPLAYKAGLLTQKETFDYLSSIADDSIKYDFVVKVLSLFDEPEVLSEVASYFAAYNGVLLFDTDDDGLVNLYVKYSRGRPQTLFFDQNQDGIYEWTIACDFGTPVGGSLQAARMDVTWGTFPYVKTVAVRDAENNVQETFTLVQDALAWSPVSIERDKAVSDSVGADFFVPVIHTEPYAAPYTVVSGAAQEEIIGMQASGGIPSIEMLLAASYNVTVPSQERAGAEIVFEILHGKVQKARYFQGKTLYAQAEFSNGEPNLRLVDADGDGIFETTEFYAPDTEGNRDVHSLEEEKSIMTMLFGTPSNAAGYYLRMVQVDTNADTIPDYTEEYLVRGGRIASWDTDGDGLWNVRTVRLPRSEGEDVIREQNMFYDGKNQLVTVTIENGIPVLVRSGSETLRITEDERYRFYWIGKAGTTELAKKSLKALNERGGQGAVVVVQDDTTSERVLAIRIGETCYGKIEPAPFPDKEATE